MADQGGTIGAVEHSYRILDVVVENDGATLAEITERVDLSSTSVHTHLRTLLELGCVRKDGERYEVGYRPLTIGGPVRDRLPLFANARQAVDELHELTGELSLLATRHRGETMVLYHRGRQDSVNVDMNLGTTEFMHCTASGKAMLASLGPEAVGAVVDDHGLPERTSNTITDENELREELAVVRDRGYALNREERIAGVRGVAAPICHRETDRVLGAIAVLGPVTELDGERFTDEIPELVTRNAETVEVDISYS